MSKDCYDYYIEINCLSDDGLCMDYMDGWELKGPVNIQHYFHLKLVVVEAAAVAAGRLDMDMVDTDDRYAVALMEAVNLPMDFRREADTCSADCVHNTNL